MSLNRRREEFPTLAAGIHLLSHSLGPMPRATREAMLDYCDAWERHTNEDAWATSWWELSQRVGDRIAVCLGARTGSVQIQPNTSVALSTVVSCFDFNKSRRNKIITTELDFPSMSYIWDAQKQLGAQVDVIPSTDGITVSTDRICEAMDERTCLVALSHASYRSSYLVNAAEICERAHEKGALVLLDVYQSAGALKLDAGGWQADFMIGGTIKWLCGGPACGYLYVRPELQPDLEPRLTGWVAHAVPFAFAKAPMKYAKSVRRFAQGTPSIPALYSTIPGLEMIESFGIENIEMESRRRTQMMIEFALERGWQVNSPREAKERGGSVMIGVTNAAKVVEQLAGQKVFVDSRPNAGLRMSPHFFNTDEEVLEALRILQKLIG